VGGIESGDGGGGGCGVVGGVESHVVVSVTEILPVYRTRLIMPGMMIRNKGDNLRKPARRVAPCACAMFLAASALCTITCSTKFE
jgi:ABC-type enterochelin transport system permease subunit